MNISHKHLFNNNFSKEKRQFYEKIGNRYYHAYLKYQKKYSNNKDYKKRIINWFFSKDEETRMILCSIENKKYTKIINDAYNRYIKSPNTKIYLKDDEDDSKINLLSINDSRLNSNEYNYYSKQRQFLNEIMFYQCETPLNDYDKYSNYFTLSNIIKDQTTFINFCNKFTNNNFLQNPIEPKIKEQNKLFNTIYFKFPEWLYEDNLPNNNFKCNNFYYDNEIELKLYYSLEKFILALLDQVLSVRYIIYNETNNLEEVLSSIYLYDLFEKKNKIILYLTPKEIKYSYLYFKIDELSEKLYNDKNLEEFINKNKIKEEGAFVTDIYFDKEDNNIKDIVLEGSQFFNKFFRENTPKDFIDFFMFIHIQKIFSYDDFYFRGVFEKIYETYSNQTYNDLILNEEKVSKKKRKKKKKNGNESTKNNDNINNNISDERNIKKIKNINKRSTSQNKNLKKNIDLGDEILKILSESGISQNNELNIINEITNLNPGKEEIIKDCNNLYYGEKIKIENKNVNNFEKKDNKNIINILKEKENCLISKFIKDLIYENIFKEIEIKDNINIKKNKKRNKQKDFFLYDTQKSSKKKKKNNSIKINELTNNKINKDINNDIVNNNKNNIILKENYIKINQENEKIDKKESNMIMINKEIKDKKEKVKKEVNKPKISHINSFSFKSTNNKKSEINKENIINNNIINFNFQNSFIFMNKKLVNTCFNKLNNSIEEYYNELEETLLIQRKIKNEIAKYLLSIIKKLFPDSSILVYGSSLYNLDIDTSDLDLSITTESKISLIDLEKSLLDQNNNNQFSKINAILSASVPIIKFEIDYLKLNNEEINHLYNLLKNTKYYKTNYNIKNKEIKKNYMNIINIDISSNSANYKQINFIKHILADCPEIKPLIKIIKKILQIKDMNNSYKGGMSSYCLLLLIYSYIKFYHNEDKESTINNNDYGTLLINLLYFYILYVDFKSIIIAPHLSNPFIMDCHLDSIPTIIEPISKQNVGKNIFKIFDVVNILYQIYKDIFIIMEEKDNDNLIYKLIGKYYYE